jgi:hypothetical protein
MSRDEPMKSQSSPGEEAGKPGGARTLGVVEAITAVTRQCPHGSVVGAAEQALATIKERGADAIPEQAFLVLSAIQGWRGEVARQVHVSLQSYLEEHEKRRKEASHTH